MNDWQLLQDYATQGSETAFRTLVDRYLNLVHAAALRQVRVSGLAKLDFAGGCGKMVR